MSEVFISYTRADRAIARHFAEGFEREGLSVWWDQALNPGEAFDQITERALEEAKAVVVLWSKASVDSRWVRAEATQANATGRMVPVMIEPCRRPKMDQSEFAFQVIVSNANPLWPRFRWCFRGGHPGGGRPIDPVRAGRLRSPVSQQ